MSGASLGRWPVRLEIPLAWGEMDAFGHANNTVYLRWFESARIAYLDRAGLLARVADGVMPVLARVTLDYRLPLVYPDTVEAATTVTRLGNSSFTMGFRLVSRARGALAAEGEGVVVLVDARRQVSVPLDADLRRRIETLEAGAPPSV